MRLDLPDEQFVGLLDWSCATLREVRRTGRAEADALAAAAAIRATAPRTLTVPSRVERLLQIWQQDYREDVERTIGLLERTVLDERGSWQPRPDSYADLHEAALRRNMTSRHQAVPLAARLFALTGDRRYLQAIVGLMRQFVAEAPPCPDGPRPGYARWMANYSGMDVLTASHVSENWLLALPLIHRQMEDAEYLRVLKALAAMADFQYRCWRRAFYFNFCLHGVKAGASAGLAFPQFADAGKWLQMGCERFFGDLCRAPACLPDGCTREGLGYQNVNAYLHTKWYLLCRAHEIPVPAHFRANLERIMEFAATVVRPDGSQPQQGEAAADAPHEHYVVAHELLHVGAALFDRPDLRAAAGNVRDDQLRPTWMWILDPQLYARWRQMAAPGLAGRQLRSGRLADSKYFVLRDGAGLDGLYGMLMATDAINHGHHDALHIELYGLGRTLLSDTGHGGYASAIRHRDLRPRRHNSICIYRLDPAGPNRWPLDLTRQVAWVDQADWAVAAAEHELYGGFRVRRALMLVKPVRCFVVYDRVESMTATLADVTVETHFHFTAPESPLGRDEAGRSWSAHEPERSVWLYPTGDLEAPPSQRRGPFRFGDICRQIEWADGDANVLVVPLGPEAVALHERAGWICLPGGAVKRPVAEYRWLGVLPFEQAYLLVPFRGTSPPLEGVWGRAEAPGLIRAGVDGRQFEIHLGQIGPSGGSGPPRIRWPMG